VIDEARVVAASLPPPEPVLQRAPQIGDRVRVSGLGTVGEVVALRSGEIEVRAGSMTVRARPDEVAVVSGAAGAETKTRESWLRGQQSESRGAARLAGGAFGRGDAAVAHSPERAAASSLEDALRVPANTLDLRGVRVEEGLAMLEAFLDESMIASRDVVFVLHGHGTGAMRTAIRRALAESRYVSRSAPASDEQGGDAFSVAKLRG